MTENEFTVIINSWDRHKLLIGMSGAIDRFTSHKQVERKTRHLKIKKL